MADNEDIWFLKSIPPGRHSIISVCPQAVKPGMPWTKQAPQPALPAISKSSGAAAWGSQPQSQATQKHGPPPPPPPRVAKTPAPAEQPKSRPQQAAQQTQHSWDTAQTKTVSQQGASSVNVQSNSNGSSSLFSQSIVLPLELPGPVSAQAGSKPSSQEPLVSHAHAALRGEHQTC